jgi:SAM-dependent methyltransferase
MTTATDANRRTWEANDVAAHYAALDYLSPCERLLFETYIPVGSAILDVGVGGGRTTPFLVNRASRYVGVDYAAAMVKSCQAKFPGLEFVTADAADLSRFTDASFDVVVFAFNGIDNVLPDDRRHSCLRHFCRILKPGGILIFSSHNPRSVMIRPSWNRERLRQLSARLSAGSGVLRRIFWVLLTVLRAGLAVCRSFGASLLRVVRRIPTRMFWRGEGILWDPVHGGLVTHYGTPACVIRELETGGFRPMRVLGDDYPLPSHPYVTDWYYYVFAKSCEK